MTGRRRWQAPRWVLMLVAVPVVTGGVAGYLLGHGVSLAVRVAWLVLTGAALFVLWGFRPDYRSGRRAHCIRCGWRGPAAEGHECP